MVIRPEEIEQASRKQSLAGGLCQLSGSLLAVIAGALTIGTVFSGGGFAGLLFGGSATFALALAGAPLAAIGSIANSQKASKELLLLYVRESAADLPRRRPSDAEINPETVALIESLLDRKTAGFAPPPPPPPRA